MVGCEMISIGVAYERLEQEQDKTDVEVVVYLIDVLDQVVFFLAVILESYAFDIAFNG
jgi:hypothetical protein